MNAVSSFPVLVNTEIMAQFWAMTSAGIHLARIAGEIIQVIRITAPHFVAGVELNRMIIVIQGKVKLPFCNRCAPILHYMRTWSPIQIMHYCSTKGWQFEIIDVAESHRSILEQRQKIIASGNAEFLSINELKRK